MSTSTLTARMFKNQAPFDQYDLCQALNAGKKIRKRLEKDYGVGDQLKGKCIEATLRIYDQLSKKFVKPLIVEGWVRRDNENGLPTAWPHYWLEIPLWENIPMGKPFNESFYLDVTGDQFNSCLINPFPPILIRRSTECPIYRADSYRKRNTFSGVL